MITLSMTLEEPSAVFLERCRESEIVCISVAGFVYFVVNTVSGPGPLCVCVCVCVCVVCFFFLLLLFFVFFISVPILITPIK